MPKTIFTTITPLPPGVSREIVLETLHDSRDMISLGPTHTESRKIDPPADATPEEYHCTWYQITDKISYFPGVKGRVSFNACFHNLNNGMQNHVYAPMGLDIKEKWTVGGNAPGEPVQPAEIGIGAPVSGLYLREDVEMKCPLLMTRFVKGQLKDALATLVARLVVKTQLREASENNKRLEAGYLPRPPMSPPLSPPNSGGLGLQFPRHSFKGPNPNRFSTQTAVSEMEGSSGSQGSPGYQPAQWNNQNQNPYDSKRVSPGYPPSQWNVRPQSELPGGPQRSPGFPPPPKAPGPVELE